MGQFVGASRVSANSVVRLGRLWPVVARSFAPGCRGVIKGAGKALETNQEEEYLVPLLFVDGKSLALFSVSWWAVNDSGVGITRRIVLAVARPWSWSWLDLLIAPRGRTSVVCSVWKVG